MKPVRTNPKHSQSSPNLPPPKQSSSQHQSNQEVLLQHRKQIQSTLNQLHRLQSQIYQLNVPQNPHSSSPVKKQIKQLSYLYENMAKPKVKNSLNVRSDDIQLAMRIMNKDWTPDTQLQPQISEQPKSIIPSGGKRSNQIDLLRKTNNISAGITFSKGSTNFKNTIKSDFKNSLIDRSYQIPKKTIQQKFQSLTHSPLNLNFISKNERNDHISTKQLYEFINFTQCQNFDPIQKAYQMFLNQHGQFDLNIYNHFNDILGLPKIKNINTFIAAISQSFDQQQKKMQQIQRQSQQKNRKQIDRKQIDKKQTKNDNQQVNQYIYGNNIKNSNKMTAKITLQQFKKVLQLEI